MLFHAGNKNDNRAKISKSGQRRISKLCDREKSKIDFVKTTCNLTLCFACFCLPTVWGAVQKFSGQSWDFGPGEGGGEGGGDITSIEQYP